jgi:hypothetical protein
MKTVPYTTSTGIQIGLRWNESPKPMPIDDADMLFLQEALLATPGYIYSKRVYEVSVALSGMGFLFMVFWFFLFN